jgi:catechol 2,3-dioxygenase-like lactoylglutathione lyase family enzyme
MSHVHRLEHLGVVVRDLDAATTFFLDLGLELEGTATVEGEWAGNIIGLKDVHSDVAMLRTPDGAGKLELSRFHSPVDDQEPDAAPANRLGLRHVAFVVDGLGTIVDKLGAEIIGRQDYSGYEICYLRGPEGIIVELIEQKEA